MLWAFKLHGCADCGIRFPEIAFDELHCDHRDPTTKIRGRAYNLGARSDGGLREMGTNEGLLRELMKCDVVCAKCHVKRGRARRNGVHQLSLFGGLGVAWIYDSEESVR
jgi:hypothetical protein